MILPLLAAAALALGCSSSSGGNTGGGNTGSGSTGGGGSGPEKECTSVTGCASDEFCDFFYWTCGPSSGSAAFGSCQKRPTSCDAVYAPVCGCDGAVHANNCEVAMAGFGLAVDVACPTPAGYFRCGYAYCKTGESWCREGFESSFSCEPLPDACKQPGAGCECLGFVGEEPGPDSPPDCHHCYAFGSTRKLECGAF